MEKKYDKLIRDRIPNIIKNSGKNLDIEYLEKDEHIKYLNKKLYEELEEYMESGETEELADLVEVIYSILDLKNISIDQFEKIREKKANKKGSFKKGIKLIRVCED